MSQHYMFRIEMKGSEGIGPPFAAQVKKQESWRELLRRLIGAFWGNLAIGLRGHSLVG